MLWDEVIQTFRVAKVFHENTQEVNYIDFSPSGESMLSSSNDNRINVYNCVRGKKVKTINSQTFDVGLTKYTHSEEEALSCSSTTTDHGVRHVSLTYENDIHYFMGHTNKVVSLSISSNTFVTGSLDQSIRLWDLRSPNCRERLTVMGRPVVGIDPGGYILAVGTTSNRNQTLQLYDIRLLERGPFKMANYSSERELRHWMWIDLKFSHAGDTILLPTNGPVIRLVSSSDGTPVRTLTGHENTKGFFIEASFSPDSQLVFSGSTNGQIHAWKTVTGNKVCNLFADNPDPIHCMKFNPKLMMIASARVSTTFWLPVYADETNL